MRKVNSHSTKKVWEKTILSEPEIHTIPKTWGKWISIVWEKYWKTQRFSIFFATPQLNLFHAILDVWECTNSHKMEILCRKPYHSLGVSFWGNQKFMRHPNGPHSMGNLKFHTMGTLFEKLIYSHTMSFE